MEMNAVEAAEEFKINGKSDEDPIQILEKHLGKLLFILKLLGVPIVESRRGNRRQYLFDCLLKLCYPIFLHVCLFYMLYATFNRRVLNYASVIDTFFPIPPIAMFWVLIQRQNTLKLFLIDLSNITAKNFTSRNGIRLCCYNAGACFIFIFPLLIFAVRIAQDNVINVFEVFRILQETIFPCAMVVTYSTICCLLLQNLRSYKRLFCKRIDIMSFTDMMKDYFDVIKTVETFEKLFCNVLFALIVQDFCIVSILVFDMMLMEEFMEKVIAEAVSELTFVFLSLGIMSFYAGNISLEMASIKSALSEKLLDQFNQDNSTNHEKYISFLLNKDIRVLTAGKVFVFDRGFLLKAIIFIMIGVICICEVMYFTIFTNLSCLSKKDETMF